MAMPLRIEYAGACYHVIDRGNYRRDLFAENKSGEAFERTLGEAATKFGWRVYASVVMINHFHLAIELTEPNLSEGMRWLQATWVRRYNARKRVGKPFKGRYKALIAERGAALGRVCHYIHLNPVRAGAVPVAKIADYALSSLTQFRSKKRPEWLEPSIVLQEAGELRDTGRGWQHYLRYLEFLTDDKEAKVELSARKLSRGWCIGGEAFRQEMRNVARERGAALDLEKFEGIAPDELEDEKVHAWEERLRLLATLAKIDLRRLDPKKSDPGKVLLAAAMKQSTSARNAWLAERLAMGKPDSVSQFSRRLLLTERGRKSVNRLLSGVKH